MSHLQSDKINILYLKYMECKKKYLKLKRSYNKVNNFSQIVENAYNYAIKKFGDMYIIINNDPYKIFRLHQFGEDKRYKFNRYLKSDQPIECENKKFIINNPDVTFDFIKEKENNIFIDTKINRLPINSSNGTTQWESYNWTLYRNPNKSFHIAFGRMNDSFKAELGVKHTMLGQQNDFYAGGEIRIVHNANKIIVQVNLDSSSFGPGFANILKNLCTRYKQCIGILSPCFPGNDKGSKYCIDNIKNICPFELKEEKYNIACNNFEKIYDDILNFKIIGKVPNQPSSHFEEPKEDIKYKKLQKILNKMTTVIKDVIKNIFKNLIDDPAYMLQVVGDEEWYNTGLKNNRGLHWYYYNDICPTIKYISEANKWATIHNTEEFIKEVKLSTN